MPLEWPHMRSTARWVLPVLVGPSTAVTGERANWAMMGPMSCRMAGRARTLRDRADVPLVNGTLPGDGHVSSQRRGSWRRLKLTLTLRVHKGAVRRMARGPLRWRCDKKHPGGCGFCSRIISRVFSRVARPCRYGWRTACSDRRRHATGARACGTGRRTSIWSRTWGRMSAALPGSAALPPVLACAPPPSISRPVSSRCPARPNRYWRPRNMTRCAAR